MSTNIQEGIEKLATTAIFNEFDIKKEEDRRVLQKVYENCSVKTFKKGETIIKEGEVGSEFYILNSGSVHISRQTPAGDSIALADLNDKMNIFFGETALVSDDTRTATVEATSVCQMVVLTGNKFHELSQDEPILGYRVLKVLAKRMAGTIRETNKDKALLYEALFNEISGDDEEL